MGSYTVGLDLGQTDFTALAVVERVHTPPDGMTVEQWERRAATPAARRPVVEHHVRHSPAGRSARRTPRWSSRSAA